LTAQKSNQSIAAQQAVYAVQDDFKNMTPLNPRHFLMISKRCYSALAKNNMKVTEKDL
jgi:hypothetical protein